MRMDRIAAGPRRPTNVTLSEELLADAKTLGINVSRACETGLAAEVKKAREAKWVEENRDAMEAWNDWVDEHGLPLAHLRPF
jgi:antitoxin CcdA